MFPQRCETASHSWVSHTQKAILELIHVILKKDYRQNRMRVATCMSWNTGRRIWSASRRKRRRRRLQLLPSREKPSLSARMRSPSWLELQRCRQMNFSTIETETQSLSCSEFRRCHFLLKETAKSLCAPTWPEGCWRHISGLWKWTGNTSQNTCTCKLLFVIFWGGIKTFKSF